MIIEELIHTLGFRVETDDERRAREAMERRRRGRLIMLTGTALALVAGWLAFAFGV